MNKNKEEPTFDKSQEVTDKILKLLNAEAYKFDNPIIASGNLSFSLIEALAFFLTRFVEKKSLDHMTEKACEKLKQLVEIYREDK